MPSDATHICQSSPCRSWWFHGDGADLQRKPLFAKLILTRPWGDTDSATLAYTLSSVQPVFGGDIPRLPKGWLPSESVTVYARHEVRVRDWFYWEGGMYDVGAVEKLPNHWKAFARKAAK